jgi:ABC-type sugar transport system ATPase subunit
VSEIVFEGVTKRFGDVTAVDDLDLRIEDEEFMVLLGPSGCGKTTVLRMVAGLDSITSGTLRIGDRVVNDVEAKRRNVSMVFQSYALYPHLTVFKNIESPLIGHDMLVDGEDAPRRLHPHERRERVGAVAGSLGLTELLDRKPAALSGGQRQRVALARAIVSRPAAFLMDEPLSNLDAKLRSHTRIELAEMHKRLAATFVYVTHDQIEAMTMADRLAIIDQGRLQQTGTPREVYDEPRNLFVARFIGSPPMNTIPATIRVVDGEPWAQTGAGRMRLPRLDTPVGDGTEVMIGVRPEDLHRHDGALDGVVRTVEWLGRERLVLCDVAGTLVTISEPAEKRDPAPGEPIAVGCDPANVHVFDAHSTQRVS